MSLSNSLKFLILVSLAVFALPSFVQHAPTITPIQLMASYNPAPANNFKAPLSDMAQVAVTGAKPNAQALASASNPRNPSNYKTIQQNALRFITDTSYFPQTETTVAVDPNNPDHVVGGFNDQKAFFCSVLPDDCGIAIPASVSGFTVSTDGGRTVAKSSDLPDFNMANNNVLISWGDPSLAASVDGNFFFSSLAISSLGPFFGNGIMIAKSNSSLFNPNISCNIDIFRPFASPCWNAVFVNGTVGFGADSLEDKDRVAVDRSLSSPYYGSVYIGWDHFYPNGTSASFLSRCDNDLASCTMLSPSGNTIVSGSDPFVSWTTPVVDKNGNVHVAWCNFGTRGTFGPIYCRTTSSPPGGNSFGPVNNIFSYMGAGTTLPDYTVVIGWATEQFRTGPGLISFASDQSSKTNNLYLTTNVCIAGHYYQFSSQVAPVASDNPGDCGTSAILVSVSADGGTTWSVPTTLSKPVVNDQPFVTVDTQTGTVFVVYYTTQYDQFNHRIDVAASISSNGGRTFAQQRITMVSNEPDSDPNMFNYLVPAGFGGSFTVPQYGDYFEATAVGGTLWVLFTANYAVEAGIFQADPFLAVTNH